MNAAICTKPADFESWRPDQKYAWELERAAPTASPEEALATRRNGSSVVPMPAKGAGKRKPAPSISEIELAQRFVDRHAHQLRFVDMWGKWMVWDGTLWEEDDTRHAADLARVICAEAADELSNKSIGRAKMVSAVLYLASVDRRIAATVDQWDADPWLLNTPDGVVDLRTGKLRPHKPDAYMTKVAGVGPRGDCPLFLRFLHRITGGDADLVAYLQRVLGYALTGVTSEHALFFAYGTGANGKSVLLSTVAGLLGDYHKTSAMETFTASKGDRHPTELADLRGARLVTASETEEGRHWAESRIKQLTGGDRLSARFMRQDLFEFQPTFKLVIAGNHKPSLRSVDEAMRRRFHMIPFAVTIPAAERDGELTEKLKAEWPGVLKWLIDGCLRWQGEKLSPPKAVTAATAEYMEAEDATASWIADKCEVDPSAWCSSMELFASWSAWATKAGEQISSQKRLTQTLESRGFRRHRMNHGQGFCGLRVRHDAGPKSDEWRAR
jgi:putative DNA primase/helicase